MSEVKLPSAVIQKNLNKLMGQIEKFDGQITPNALNEAREKISQQIHRTPSRVSIGLGSLFGQGKEVKEESSHIRQLRDKILNP
ncbi:MAG TPA: hypothetical protein VGM34_04260 [Chlamydiales bacterium]|jgi:pyrrolidone-carboxylate peptidase